MKVVLGYNAFSDYAVEWHEGAARRARDMGFNVEAFSLTPEGFNAGADFSHFDRHWRKGDRRLREARERLCDTLSGADVLWNFNGSWVHPAWLDDLQTLNVFGFFDDPESTARLSAPAARYFDAALVGNLSCLSLYESWGMRRVAWAPLAFLGGDSHPVLTPEQVLSEERGTDAVFLGERETEWRRRRLDALARAFPQATFHGRGWETGYVSIENRRAIYRDSKIGWNLHNSIGPINQRFFALPAAGVLQICDNRCRSGQVFELGEEIVGFDSIDECIELTRYYLEHDEERRRIAANGLKKYREMFSEERLWEYYYGVLGRWLEEKRRGEISPPVWSRDSGGSEEGALGRAVARRAARIAKRLARRKTVDPAENHYNLDEQEGPAGAEALAGSRRLPESTFGSDMELPEIAVVQQAAAALVGGAKRIVDLAGRRGGFAFEASADSQRKVTCWMSDSQALAWAEKNRSRENTEYVLAPSSEDGTYDLAVILAGPESPDDPDDLVDAGLRLAPRALILLNEGSGRRLEDLQSKYKEIEIFSFPMPCVPALMRASFEAWGELAIADCRGPMAP